MSDLRHILTRAAGQFSFTGSGYNNQTQRTTNQDIPMGNSIEGLEYMDSVKPKTAPMHERMEARRLKHASIDSGWD